MALGFLLYLLLDRLLLLGHAHADGAHDHHGEHARGSIRAGSISLHSLVDVLGIGFAFQVSPAVGIVVGLAILAHDFSDGINTVNVIVRHGGDARTAWRWLLLDAIAPVVGVLATFLLAAEPDSLGILMALVLWLLPVHRRRRPGFPRATTPIRPSGPRSQRCWAPSCCSSQSISAAERPDPG